MKKQALYFSMVLGMLFQACKPTPSNEKEVKIGNQIWMSTNLNTDHFRNGDPIPEVKSIEEWSEAGDEGKPAYCYHKGDPANVEKLGKLYNWYAVSDPRGLAPTGWKIPSDADWKEMENFLGGEEVSGHVLKSKSMWANQEDGKSGGGSNESGFNALPGGFRYFFGEYNAGSYGYWWTSTGTSATNAWGRSMNSYSSVCGRSSGLKSYGFSVRCIRE
jgi:uncharacterized protein (TIGR02145 family)